MAVMSEEKRAVFLANPGTGSTSVVTVLVNDLGWKRVGNKHDGFDKVAKISEIPLSECFVFTTVRNPFEFFVSEFARFRGSWAESMRNNPTHWIHDNASVKERIAIALTGDFEGFVDYYLRHTAAPDGRWRYQYWEKSNFIMRTENLENDFSLAMHRLNITNKLPLHRVNSTPETQKADAKRLFTADLAEKVSEKYARYIEVFNYSIPEYCRAKSENTKTAAR